MKGSFIFTLPIVLFMLFSCENTAPKKTIITPNTMKSDSSLTLNVKPLSTEKTHEGGVDKTKLNFK